ncbi:MAG: hypothetical protein ACR2FO_04305 [Actinomycetota bacterium]
MVNKAALKWGIGCWAALRVVASAGAWYSVNYLRMNPAVQTPGYTPPVVRGGFAEVLLGPWLRQDALQYLKIATEGYHDTASLAFYPAFPLLTGGLAKLVGNELIAGLVVANLACLVGFVLLFAFVEKAAGISAARSAVGGLAVFPTAFFLVAPYGEAVLLAAGAGALLAALTGRPVLAFFLGVVAALSRPFGVLLFLPLLAIAFGSDKKTRWLAPAGPLVGIAVWIGFAGFVAQDPWAAFSVQANWQRAPEFFPVTLVNGFTYWRKSIGSGFENYFLLDLAAAIFALGILPAAARIYRSGSGNQMDRGQRMLTWGMVAYGLAVLIVATSSPFPPRPLLSLPRFALALFPLFAAFGLVHHRVRIPLAAASAGGLFIATAVYVASRPLF